MAKAALPLQKALFEALKGDAELMARVTGVFDSVPEKQTYPYVVIGEDTHVPFDTDTSRGSEATQTIHVWDQGHGRKRTKEIQALIYELLHFNELDVEGFDQIVLEQEFCDSSLDPDGRTYHGVQRFRSLNDEEEA